jgi:F-type H+-transporting ATPase subunit delta
VETSGGIRASLAGRYASALFDLAREQRQIESVSASLASLAQAIADSKDLAELIQSPLVSRDEAGNALSAIAPQLSLDPITVNFLGVLARNGRKSQLMAVIRARAGRDVTIEATVDPAILGGIVVKLGSNQIDASIRTKLNRLAHAMKG